MNTVNNNVNPIRDPQSALGDEDAIFAIADDGTDFLAAISVLENANASSEIHYLYLDWRMYKVGESAVGTGR